MKIENADLAANIGCYVWLIVLTICITILKLNGAI